MIEVLTVGEIEPNVLVESVICRVGCSGNSTQRSAELPLGDSPAQSPTNSGVTDHSAPSLTRDQARAILATVRWLNDAVMAENLPLSGRIGPFVISEHVETRGPNGDIIENRAVPRIIPIRDNQLNAMMNEDPSHFFNRRVCDDWRAHDLRHDNPRNRNFSEVVRSFEGHCLPIKTQVEVFHYLRILWAVGIVDRLSINESPDQEGLLYSPKKQIAIATLSQKFRDYCKGYITTPDSSHCRSAHIANWELGPITGITGTGQDRIVEFSVIQKPTVLGAALAPALKIVTRTLWFKVPNWNIDHQKFVNYANAVVDRPLPFTAKFTRYDDGWRIMGAPQPR